MEIEITQTSKMTGKISDRDAQLVAKKVLSKIFLIPLNSQRTVYYINKDNNLIKRCELSAGSHSYDEITLLRPATEMDKLFFKVINIIEKGIQNESN